MPNMPKNAEIYICKPCDFKCSKLSNYNIHLTTLKHQNRTILNNLEHKNAVNCKFTCKLCEKSYKARNSLWYHEKKCFFVKEPIQTTETNLIVQLLKQNDEFKNMLLEQNTKMLETVQDVCKNNNTTNIVNSNNKAFNLNVFLNETCKDAMDINEFEDSIKLQLSDLELVGRLGFVDGISSIIIKNLKALKVNERPVHCTDLKRETMYVNDKGIWEKQENDNKKLRRLIKHIAFKNAKNLTLYKELHPDYNDYYSKCSDHFLKLQIEAFGGSGNETVDNENKIIKKIVKEMGIDKNRNS